MIRKILVFFILSLFIQSCQNAANTKQSDDYIRLEGTALGTFFTITYLHPEKKDFSSSIDSLFLVFNSSLSTYQENSIISKVNKNEPIELDKYFVFCFNKARQVYEKTNGAFDITIAPIVNAYGFGFENGRNIDKSHIDSLLQFVGMDKVRIENNRIVKDFPQTMLDGNAIAKGYCVDIIGIFLAENNCKNYMVEIGGEIVTKGKNPQSENWRIGIDKPIDDVNVQNRQLQEVINVTDWALATSGNYRKFYEQNGVKYSHTIDPKTGKSVRSNLLSATILASDCITADAYATACMVIGLEESLKLINGLENMHAYFIYSDEKGDYQIAMTKGMKKFIE